jgi:hypothetical protein
MGINDFIQALRASGGTNAGLREYIGAIPAYSPPELAGAQLISRQTREIGTNQAAPDDKLEKGQIAKADYDRERQQNMNNLGNFLYQMYTRPPYPASGYGAPKPQ